MNMKNKVFIATSIDGYIADKNGEIDWLHSIPNPENNDMGYAAFISKVDALVMGRTTFETICNFDIEWPFQKPVFVLSNSLSKLPIKYSGKAELLKGSLTEILEKIHAKGFFNLYIDGGKYQHEPLKLNVIIEAPIEAMNNILEKHKMVRDLCDNGWIYLLAMDEEGKVSHRYNGNLTWEKISSIDAAA